MRPIGVFDSGVGGLTVVRALRERLPRESILYLGDTARLPYGTKSAVTVERYTRRNLQFLVSRGVKAAVVACNTASALALPELDLVVPTWGVIEPGARRAAAASSGRVGVIATESTVESGAYERALKTVRPELDVVSQACPLFVPLVEAGWEDDPLAEQIAARYLEPLLEAKIDTMVLGCTHYPLLEAALERVTNGAIDLVDSAHAVADEVADGLADLSLLADPQDPPPEHHFCVTDAGDRFAAIAQRILGAGSGSLELVDVA